MVDLIVDNNRSHFTIPIRGGGGIFDIFDRIEKI